MTTRAFDEAGGRGGGFRSIGMAKPLPAPVRLVIQGRHLLRIRV